MKHAVTMRDSLRRSVGKRCPYCDRPMDLRRRRPTRDHVFQPKSRGGTFENGNKLIVCALCNVDKGHAPLYDWLVQLREAGDFRAVFVEEIMFRNRSGIK